MKIGGSISDGVSSRRRKIWLRFGFKDSSERSRLNLQNLYYLPKSPCNLISFGLLNDSDIYHDNKNEMLYEVNTRQTLAHAQRQKNSYLLKPLNLSDGAVNILRVDDSTYQQVTNILHIMANFLLSTTLTTWHKRLSHTNFIAFRIFLYCLKIPFVNDSKNYICDSCKKAKTTKVYNCESQKCAQ